MLEILINLFALSIGAGFVGAISGLGFAYCDFTRRNARVDLTPTPTRPVDNDVLRTSISE